MSAQSCRHFNLPNRPAGPPLSDAVLVGDTLSISARIGLDPATGEAPTSIDAEIDLLSEGFQAVALEAGMTMDELVGVQVYSPDVSLWQRCNVAYVKLLTRGFPARAFLGSGTLLADHTGSLAPDLRLQKSRLPAARSSPARSQFAISLAPPRTPVPTTVPV